MHTTICYCLAALLSSLYPPTPGVSAGNEGKLVLRINNVQSRDGQLLLAIYNQAKTFGDMRGGGALRTITVPATQHIITIPDLPFGKYAVVVAYDKNLNQALDFNFLGIPREGFGVSNGLKNKLRHPRFEESAFHVDKPSVEASIDLVYF